MLCFSTDFWSKDAANTDAGVRQNMDIDGQYGEEICYGIP